VLKKNVRSGAKGCKNDKTKTKNEDGEKLEDRRKKRVRQNSPATRILRGASHHTCKF
jgi:hypothetical protein